MMKKGAVKLQYVATEEQTADVFHQAVGQVEV